MTEPLEIVGGGLAGLSLGLALRRKGVPVALHEAGAYPRHRVCGEFIAGLDDATIGRLGLAPILSDAVRHETVAWYRGGETVRRQRLPRPALGLSRRTLDARLAEAFAAANGCLRCNSRVTPLAPAAGRILATGRRRAKSPWLGLKAHVVPPRGSPGFAPSGLEVHLGRDAYVGLSAVEGGRWNLCGFFRRPAVEAASRRFPFPLLDFLQAAGLDALAARVAPYLDPSSFTAVAALQVNRFVFRGPALALGDACAMIPPFTGDGMAMAFQSADLALGPLAGYARGELTWPAAVRSVQSALRRRFAVRLASAAALHPFLLRPTRQRWLAAAAQAGILPLRSLYSLLH